MLVKDFHDIIIKLREEGKTFREVSKYLEEKHEFKVTYQAISKYVRKLDLDKLESVDVLDTLNEEELEFIKKSKSARQAHISMTRNGYNIPYRKVLEIRKGLLSEEEKTKVVYELGSD